MIFLNRMSGGRSTHTTRAEELLYRMDRAALAAPMHRWQKKVGFKGGEDDCLKLLGLIGLIMI
jgi:hypothetical protein